jgi:putative protein-disulfide isomerase
MLKFVYIADPMCSWCYGFAPELNALLTHYPDAALDVIVGGLRAYNQTPATAEARAQTKGYWQQVASATAEHNLKFNSAALDLPGFIYNTEPACRAIVAIRQSNQPEIAKRALEMFHALQIAFYADGRDITQGAAIAEVAANMGIDGGAFLQAWQSEQLFQMTRNDFLAVQELQINGFPFLAIDVDGKLVVIARGYEKAAILIERVKYVSMAKTDG